MIREYSFCGHSGRITLVWCGLLGSTFAWEVRTVSTCCCVAKSHSGQRPHKKADSVWSGELQKLFVYQGIWCILKDWWRPWSEYLRNRFCNKEVLGLRSFCAAFRLHIIYFFENLLPAERFVCLLGTISPCAAQKAAQCTHYESLSSAWKVCEPRVFYNTHIYLQMWIMAFS